ncbi:hypothetical protein, partial [uncultured Acetatifactor sp.]|uniref:hypothetical protein n=1 Tax=uncultured Acetatifactor sp. TaxID=1671927 RepID=UPI0026265477
SALCSIIMPAQTYPNSGGNVEKTALSYPIMVTERRDCMDLLQEMNQVIAYYRRKSDRTDTA